MVLGYLSREMHIYDFLMSANATVACLCAWLRFCHVMKIVLSAETRCYKPLVSGEHFVPPTRLAALFDLPVVALEDL